MSRYPKAMELAMARPRAADLPRPRAAVITAVQRSVFSAIASMNFSTALPCTADMTATQLASVGMCTCALSIMARADGHNNFIIVA